MLGAQGMQGWRRFTFFDRDDASASAAQPDAHAAALVRQVPLLKIACESVCACLCTIAMTVSGVEHDVRSDLTCLWKQAAADRWCQILVQSESTCTASHGPWAAFGQQDGTVVLLNTAQGGGHAAFRAHPQSVQLMTVLPVRLQG